MKTFRIEVFEDSRPIHLSDKEQIVTGSNHGVALRRGYAVAKPRTRRGAKTVTVRATVLGNV